MRVAKIIAMCQCKKNPCCCERVVTKTGPRGPKGRDGKPGKDGKDSSGFDAVFTLTPNQVKNAHGTPVLLIPAPGPGKAISVTHAVARRKFVTGGYPSSVGIILTSNPTSAGQVGTASNFLSVSSSGLGTAIMANMVKTDNVILNVYENAPLYFQTGSADSASGDDIITVFVSYKILTLPN